MPRLPGFISPCVSRQAQNIADPANHTMSKNARIPSLRVIRQSNHAWLHYSTSFTCHSTRRTCINKLHYAGKPVQGARGGGGAGRHVAAAVPHGGHPGGPHAADRRCAAGGSERLSRRDAEAVGGRQCVYMPSFMSDCLTT